MPAKGRSKATLVEESPRLLPFSKFKAPVLPPDRSPPPKFKSLVPDHNPPPDRSPRSSKFKSPVLPPPADRPPRMPKIALAALDHPPPRDPVAPAPLRPADHTLGPDVPLPPPLGSVHYQGSVYYQTSPEAASPRLPALDTSTKAKAAALDLESAPQPQPARRGSEQHSSRGRVPPMQMQMPKEKPTAKAAPVAALDGGHPASLSPHSRLTLASLA